LSKHLNDETFVTLAEVTFSESEGTHKVAFMDEARKLSPYVDAIVVSDYSFGLPTMNPIVPSLWLKEDKIEPVMGFYIEHRNPEAIFSDVLAGIESSLTNVIISSYQNPKDYGTCIELVDSINKTLKKQSKVRGTKTENEVNIGLSSGYMVERPEDSIALARLAGTNFICPPETYDISGIVEPITKRARSVGMHTILKTSLFTSAKTVSFARKFIPEMFLPNDFVETMKATSNPFETGLSFVRDFVEVAKNLKANGVYLIIPQKTEVYKRLPEIIGRKMLEAD
jgi:5,10-methylenetetrahydrofolate reductase